MPCSRRQLLMAGVTSLTLTRLGVVQAAETAGILLLAHGTHSMTGPGAAAHGAHDHAAMMEDAAKPKTWDQTIEVIASHLNKKIPTEVAFGMAETEAMQTAVARLEARGVTRIAAIPLFISSHSPIIGNFRYILGLQQELGTRTMVRELARVKSKATFTFSGALDADPLVSEILLDRAKAVSADPAKTNLLIIAHGPNAEEDNKLWLGDMQKHAAYLKAKGYRSVEVLTHRNDADEAIKSAARAAFRARVEQAGRDGVTVVLPLLLAEGGIEEEVEGDLEGLKFVFGKPLAPHPNLERWVEARFQALTKAP